MGKLLTYMIVAFFVLSGLAFAQVSSFDLSLQKGWNLFSSPVYNTATAFKSFQTNCQYKSSLWKYSQEQKQYFTTTFLTDVRSSYWIYVDKDCSVKISGNKLTDLNSLFGNFPLKKGWNFIGGSPGSVEFDKIKGTCYFIRGPYSYDTFSRQWKIATSMKPGEGYIIGVGQDCELKAENELPLPPSEPAGLYQLSGNHCIVDYSNFPDKYERANEVLYYCDKHLPEIAALYGETIPTIKVKIVFTESDIAGFSLPDTITANVATSLPGKYNQFFLHEGTHFIQNYQNSYTKGDDFWWRTEGLADYTVYRIGSDEPGWNIGCSADQTYLDGYGCAAAFILWTENYCKNDNIHIELHNANKGGTSSDKVFAKTCSKTTSELWNIYESLRSTKLTFPIGCIKGKTCTGIGYPDIDKDGKSYDCSPVSIFGHTGTDIGVSWQQMDNGIPVYAAMDGKVLWVWDGKYDRCPDNNEPDCITPTDSKPGLTTGNTVCTEMGQYCSKTNNGYCYWCFASGNTVIILHDDSQIFATTYGHLKKGSILVNPGDLVKAGQKIAEVGSSGSSSGPHLHFEVWSDYYKPIDPWAGTCGTNKYDSLWVLQP